MFTQSPRNLARPSRLGFTMVELMIVIVVITILVALLVPAVMNGMRTARIAQVRTEISALENALNDFKARYGEYPPSRITLYESATAWNNTSDAEVRRSRAILRRFWPQINFNVARNFNPGWGTDTDTDTSDTIELRGAECLVFFLGGVPRNGGAGNQLNGFSKNPSDPFDRAGTNREGPFFEFNVGRLGISTVVPRMPVLLDPLPGQQRPYLYASANDGSGYDRNAAATANRDASTNGLTGVDAGERLATVEYLASGNASNGQSWKPKSFQIISPGFDGQFGQGGVWTEDGADAALTGNREAERDNITNFHNTTLAPF